MAFASSHGLAQQTQSQKDALKAATERMNFIKAATGAQPVAQRIPPGDPCTVVTLSAVQSMLPSVKVAERSKRLEADSASWNASGRAAPATCC